MVRVGPKTDFWGIKRAVCIWTLLWFCFWDATYVQHTPYYVSMPEEVEKRLPACWWCMLAVVQCFFVAGIVFVHVCCFIHDMLFMCLLIQAEPDRKIDIIHLRIWVFVETARVVWTRRAANLSRRLAFGATWGWFGLVASRRFSTMGTIASKTKNHKLHTITQAFKIFIVTGVRTGPNAFLLKEDLCCGPFWTQVLLAAFWHRSNNITNSTSTLNLRPLVDPKHLQTNVF